MKGTMCGSQGELSRAFGTRIETCEPFVVPRGTSLGLRLTEPREPCVVVGRGPEAQPKGLWFCGGNLVGPLAQRLKHVNPLCF